MDTFNAFALTILNRVDDPVSERDFHGLGVTQTKLQYCKLHASYVFPPDYFICFTNSWHGLWLIWREAIDDG